MNRITAIDIYWRQSLYAYNWVPIIIRILHRTTRMLEWIHVKIISQNNVNGVDFFQHCFGVLIKLWMQLRSYILIFNMHREWFIAIRLAIKIIFSLAGGYVQHHFFFNNWVLTNLICATIFFLLRSIFRTGKPMFGHSIPLPAKCNCFLTLKYKKLSRKLRVGSEMAQNIAVDYGWSWFLCLLFECRNIIST